MKVEEKSLTFSKTVWVMYDGVAVHEAGENLTLSGEEEDAYIKVLNHFGRVLKLYIFENGNWVDGETGGPATPFDEKEAGRVPENTSRAEGAKAAKGAKAKATAKPTAKAKSSPKGEAKGGAAGKSTGKAAGKSATASTATKAKAKANGKGKGKSQAKAKSGTAKTGVAKK